MGWYDEGMRIGWGIGDRRMGSLPNTLLLSSEPPPCFPFFGPGLGVARAIPTTALAKKRAKGNFMVIVEMMDIVNWYDEMDGDQELRGT
jgi:hypothetical protein